MAITEADIKLLQSARMTDNPDGGGRMTGNVVQSGVDNNIFDDVSNLDRVYGNVSLRKVFPSVLTNTTDKYLGARVIIDEAPADSNVHGLLFDASSLFDTRAGAKVKVEGYLSRGVLAFTYLFGDHIVGQSSIMLACAEERDAPPIGTVFVLRVQTTATSGIYLEQYVRITNVVSTFAEFSDSDGARYTLRLATCDISDPLRYDFKGWGPVRFGFVDSDMLAETLNAARTTVHNSVVADASQYYGIKPLATAATTGSFSIKADGAYSPLLPSAQIETPITDSRTNGLLSTFVPGGGPVVLTTFVPVPSAKTFVGAAILPGSFSITAGTTTVVDNGGGVLTYGGADVGSIDYVNGILTASVDVFGGRVSGTATYTPAAGASLVSQSIGVPVTVNSRALSFVQTLPSAPASRSLSVSYLAEGRWYVLSDTGVSTGSGSTTLKGGDTGYGVGVFNSTTRTVSCTFGALPDVGSSIIVTWGEESRADLVTSEGTSPYPLLAGGKMFCPLNTAGLATTERGPKTLPPNGVTLTWNDGAVKTATDNGSGLITGDATGTIDYQAGVILWAPSTLPAKNTVVTIDATKKVSNTTSVVPTGWYTSNLSVPLSSVVEPKSVRFVVELVAVFVTPTFSFPNGGGPQGDEFVYSQAPLPFHIRLPVSVEDDGLGVLNASHLNGVRSPVGTVNYSTGLITMAASTLQITVGLAISRLVTSPSVVGSYPAQSRSAIGVVSGACACNFRPFGHVGGGIYDSDPLDVVLVSGSAATDASPLSVTVPAFMTAIEYVPNGKTMGGASFKLASNTFTSGASGTLVRNVDASTGIGSDVGSVLGATGVVQLDSWAAGTTSTVTDFRAALLPAISGDAADFGSVRVTFRTATAPLRPASLQLIGNAADGTAISVTATANGYIDHARVKGLVDVETGVVQLAFCNPSATNLGTLDLTSWNIPGVTVVNADQARVETLRYNAVAYTYLPLDATVLGLDPVRLPSDGRVPIFKSGRVVVIHNTVKMAPATVANSQTVDCGRTRLARIRVFGADGLEITSGFTKSLDAGTITFTNVAGFSQPVVVEHRIEDEALCAEAQITGDLRLTRPLTHDFPADTSYVSSALVKGTLQASAQDSFAQETWTNVWSDSRIGVPILAAYNDTANPIVVTNAGAITERWLLLFTSNTAFTLSGEEVGQIITGDTSTTLAPVNPATGVPYFTLAASGWGGGWVAGNVLRFNTVGAGFPLWVSRTVMQSPSAPPGTDQLTISIRGDIDQ